jgi:hypothetical protein
VLTSQTNSSAIAQQYNLPFVMFETNTASCGGFPGVSDSFGSALWALDYGLQMAYSNFTTALFHVGGQSVFYNVRLAQNITCLPADYYPQPFTRTFNYNTSYDWEQNTELGMSSSTNQPIDVP